MGKVLRILAVVAMGLASVFNLLGGVGTSCIAWNADKYGKAFAVFVPYMTIYQIFVYLSVLVGVAGIIVTYALVRRDKWAYWGGVITMVAGLVIAGVHMYYTSQLKEVSFFQTPPTSMRFYITFLTLALFLVLRIPGLRKRVDFTAPWQGRSKTMAGGLSASIAGFVILTTPIWAGAPHMVDGYNLVNFLSVPLMVVGGLTMAFGISLVAMVALGISREQTTSWFRRGATSLYQAIFSRV